MSSDSSFLLANNISALVCFCLGWPANLLLIWLIRNRTVPAMQVWSRVLFQAALIDLLLITVTFMVQPVRINDGNMLFSYLIGPFAQSNVFIAVCFLYLYVLCSEFAKYAIAVQFIYRWLVICRKCKLSLWHYTMLLIIPAAMTCVSVTVMVVNWFHNNIPNGTHCSICPQNHTITMATLLGNMSTQLISYLLLLFTAITYAVIAATTVHIWLHSRHSLMAQQQHSLEVRRQVGYVLLVQAALPLALSLAPNVMLYLQIMFGLQRQEWVNIFYTQCWPSALLYPLVTVLIVGPYRRWLFGLFGGGTTTTTSTQLISTVQQQVTTDGREGPTVVRVVQ